MLCVGAVAVIAPLACQVPAHAGPSAAAESVWGVPTAAPDDLSLIVAYSFGNRIPPGADPARIEGEPGPVNEALADAVVAARGDRDIPVFAQTTIAEVLESKYGMRDVVTIAADRNPDGTLAYLSTDGVAARVAELRGAAVSSDTVGVVAFRDHLWRATRTTAAHGFHAYAPRGIAMPDRYDPQSGQPWTTGPERYLPTDYAGRIPLLLNGLGR
ncbi:hypothetical protein DFR68_101192 [Nocardia mexicana]|uniref:Uncharacterized protein n=2 Tax=Nocardia mexicana TaxID=279262 RepID=A0A370HIR5_9NOCA|nr:hypothetical protein DFR68_101192 [Nocardia mexicana]